MTKIQKTKQAPRGFVSLEAAAEILWHDESDRDARWGIAFLKIVADSQGYTTGGKNADVRLGWWQANADSEILVRAREVPALWPAFREWCGLPAIKRTSVSDSKPRRGRPKGSTIAGDDALVKAAINLWLTGQAKSLTHAARIVSEHAHGASAEAKYDRIRKKVVAQWQRRAPGENN